MDLPNLFLESGNPMRKWAGLQDVGVAQSHDQLELHEAHVPRANINVK